MIQIPQGFRPMLAGKVGDMSQLRFPMYASPKIDGIRCLTIGGQVLARSLKPIRNDFVRKTLEPYQGFDGELVVGNVTDKDVYPRTQSAVNSIGGEPDFKYLVFDSLIGGAATPFKHRKNQSGVGYQVVPLEGSGSERILRVGQVRVETVQELQDYEVETLALGYEGVMLRSPDSPYKFGRSTFKEQYLLKLKRFTDIEATIVDFEELMHNDNEAETNELGLTKRSSHQANKRPGGTLGALVVKADGFDKVFGVGTGFTAEMKQWIWNNRATLRGKMIKIKYQECGVKDVPRIPVFLGFRDKDDM